MTNEKMRNMSGNVRSADKMVIFLYTLMRDEIPSGKIEEIIQEIDDMQGEVLFTNGWLAKYAINIAGRLKSEED